MSGNPNAQIPYNYFAGNLPDGHTDTSWESGYLQVVTSVVVSTGAGYGLLWVELHDPEDNTRVRIEVNGDLDPPVQIVSFQGELVIGPNEGMAVYSNGATGICSVDGYLVAPLGSVIW